MIYKVKDLNLDAVKPRRAGVILYTVYNNVIYMGLGKDSFSGELTDFSGSYKYYRDKNVVQAALREFQEETLNIFNPLTYNDIKESTCIYNSDNFIIFIKIDLDPEDVCEAFNKVAIEKYTENSSVRSVEVCSIFWVPLDHLMTVIFKPKEGHRSGIMYYRTERFLRLYKDLPYYL